MVLVTADHKLEVIGTRSKHSFESDLERVFLDPNICPYTGTKFCKVIKLHEG